MATKVIKMIGERNNSFFISLLESFLKAKDSHINGNTHNIRYGEYGGHKWNGYEGYKGASNFTNYKDKEIFFYEWSDTDKQPRVFKSKNAFRLFLMESNIPTTKELESRIDDYSDLHACCKKDSKDVIFAYSKYALENMLNDKTYYTPQYSWYNEEVHGCWDD